MTYKITLEILKEKWEETGDTIEETLSKFPISWEQIKGKGVLTVSKGTKTHEHLMKMFLLRKIFSNKIMKVKWASNLEFLLKEDVKSNAIKAV